MLLFKMKNSEFSESVRRDENPKFQTHSRGLESSQDIDFIFPCNPPLDFFEDLYF